MRICSSNQEPSPYARWEFYPLDIMDSKGRVTRLNCFINLWAKHLAGCAQGLSLTSYLVSPDGCAELAPVDRPTAQKWLNDIIEHWWIGLQQPLPVTAKTALAYLAASPSGDSEEEKQKAYNAARNAYEGDGYQNPGELGYGDGVYLKRCYPDFDALFNARGTGFETLAGRLYTPLIEAVRKGQQA